jgi:hypothetical protein
MSAKNTFVQHYQKADGSKEAPPGLIKAVSLYVLDLKRAGLAVDDIANRLRELIRSAGGQSPETARLDGDIIMHSIEHYHRPVSPPPPKPPDFLG